MNGSGEAAITLWYASRVLYARMSVPYANQVDPAVYTKFQRHNYIDDLVLAKLKALNIAPSGPASDATFIRRAYLDAAGILPTSEEVEDFLADQVAGQARETDRPSAGARRVRGLLGLQVVRPAAGLQPQAARQRHVVVLQLDSRQREGRTSRGTSSPTRSSPRRATRGRTAR